MPWLTIHCVPHPKPVIEGGAMALPAGVALVISVLGVGLDGLITFGVLLGSPTVVFLGGMGSTTFTRDYVRADLGQHVRTCAGDYPGTAAPLARR